MGKTVSKYRAYSAQDLKDRASVPTAANIVVNANDITCSNISLTQVKNTIAESTYSLADICASANVNVWSAYGPTIRTVVGGYLVNSPPTTTFSLGSFAGYNDNALTPHFDNKNSNVEDFFDGPTTNFIFRCRINIGELRYDDIVAANSVTSVAFSVWDGGTPIDYVIKPIGGNGHGTDNGEDVLDFDTDAADRLVVPTIDNSTTYTLKIWFIDDDIWDYTGDNIVCRLTELDDWTHSVYIFAANHLYINAPYNSGNPGLIGGYVSNQWTLIGGSFDSSDGTYIFTTLSVVDYGEYTHAHVSAWVELGYYDSGGTWHIITTYDQTANFYDGALIDNDDIGGPWDELVYSGSVPMTHGDYGYRVIIDVDPS